jgi:hypothetical protein
MVQSKVSYLKNDPSHFNDLNKSLERGGKNILNRKSLGLNTSISNYLPE